jgi:hypothetical protein
MPSAISMSVPAWMGSVAMSSSEPHPFQTSNPANNDAKRNPEAMLHMTTPLS